MKYVIIEHLNCIDITICGVEYRIKSVKPEKLYSNKENVNTTIGECDFFEKEIRICPENGEGYKLGDQKIQETLYHEIAHAWLEESGQEDINDERTVEVMSKFAKQLLVMYDNDFIDYIYRMHDNII